ncbi:MAG: hypothetical protein JJT81_19180 [Rubellimicrobium sp.]|nr:hypothetical protein [Rubellimicrobium sp.]
MAQDRTSGRRTRRLLGWALFALAFGAMGLGLWLQVRINRGELAVSLPAGVSAVDLGTYVAAGLAVLGFVLLAFRPVSRRPAPAATERPAPRMPGSLRAAGTGAASASGHAALERARMLMAQRRAAGLSGAGAVSG